MGGGVSVKFNSLRRGRAAHTERRSKPNLSPVAFHKYIVVAPMVPTMIHPPRVRPRRRDPHSRRPHVRMSVPAVIALLVNIARSR